MKKSRTDVDLSHFIFQSHKMGALQTHSVIPIVAGDSVDFDYKALFRMAPLQRNLMVDAKVDLFAFFIPHRHIYGDKWTTFLKDGPAENVSFPGAPLAKRRYHLGASMVGSDASGTTARWRVDGYDHIWNRYFKWPADQDSVFKPNDKKSPTGSKNEYGRDCCHMKTIWSTGQFDNSRADAGKAPVWSGGSLGTVDVGDLGYHLAQYNSAVQRDWFNKRYSDVMKGTWGTGVNIDADERPLLLGRSSQFLSGYDVDATDTSSLGNYSGKSTGTVSLKLPRRHFNEHGAIWVMCLIRFPPIHVNEIHPFDSNTIDYDDFACDPRVMENTQPQNSDSKHFFSDGSTTLYTGYHPYGQFYRYHPSVVHNKFALTKRYPFIYQTLKNVKALRYSTTAQYDPVFKNPNTMGHCISQGRLSMNVKRSMSSAASTLYSN